MANDVIASLLIKLGLDAREVETGLGKAQKSISGFGRGADLAIGLGAGAVAAGLISTIDAAREWETAFAGVKKTVDTTGMSLEQETKAFAELEEGLLDLSTTIPITATELAGLAEAGGALGIARKDLVEFARVTAIIGTTTDVVAQDAATSLGKIGAVIGLTVDDYDNFGAALVDLGNKGASTESEILAVANRMSGTAKVVGLSVDEMLGWSAQMANVGINAEMAGSTFQRFAYGIQAATIQGGSKLELMAETAGMTAAAFQKAFKEDASGAIEALLIGYSKLDEAQKLNTRTMLQWNGSVLMKDLIAKLTGDVDGLSYSLDVASSGFRENTAMMAEAEKRFETVDSGMAMFWNRVNRVAITLGKTFMPMLRTSVEHLGNLVDMLGAALKAFPSVTNVVTPLVAALSGLMALKFGARFLSSMIPGGGMFAEALTGSLGGPVSGVAKKLGLSFGKVFGLAAAGAIAMILFDELDKQFGQTLELVGKVTKTTDAVKGALSLEEMQAQVAVLDKALEDLSPRRREIFQPAADFTNWLTGQAHVELGDVAKEIERQRAVLLGEIDKVQSGLRSAAADPTARQALFDIWNPLGAMNAQSGIGQIEKFLQGGVDVISGFVSSIGGVAPEVAGSFEDIVTSIRQGFGNVKQALKGGDKQMIDPATRMSNMRNRLAQVAQKLNQAIKVGDPWAISYWTDAYAKQQSLLDGLEGATGKTKGEVVATLREMGINVNGIWGKVKRDTKSKSNDAARSAISAAERTARGVARAFRGLAPKAGGWGADVTRAFAAGLARSNALKAIANGATTVMASVQDFMRTGSPTKKGPGSKDGGPEGWGTKWSELFGEGLAKGRAGRSLGDALQPRLSPAGASAMRGGSRMGGGDTHIHVHGDLINTDAHYRKLAARTERAIRSTRRERRRVGLAEG